MMVSPAIGLLTASAAGACVYGFCLVSKPPSTLRTLSKVVAVGAIAAAAWISGHAWLLAVGFTLSAAGDGILAAEPRGFLSLGLMSFLLAHAAFIVAFVHAGGGVLMFRSEPVRIAGLLATVSAAVLVIRLVWTSLGPMAGPVVIYVLTLVAMTASAFALPWSRWPVMAGAMAFFASDAILAVRLFRHEGEPKRSADLSIWWLYYGGQSLIAAGFFLRSPTAGV